MEHTTLIQRSIGPHTISAVLGDLARLSVDAIVNAANTHLAHGGGLAAAIVRAGGSVIQEESWLVAPVPVGSAAATDAGALPSRWVIHAVGPQWGEGHEERKLRSAVSAALDVAAAIQVQSVALPAISTGIFGYPKPAGTQHIVDEVLRWADAHPVGTVTKIHLTALDDETANLFASALSSLTTR